MLGPAATPSSTSRGSTSLVWLILPPHPPLSGPAPPPHAALGWAVTSQTPGLKHRLSQVTLLSSSPFGVQIR